MRQEREFLAHRANIQATIGGDNQKAIQSAFQDLMNAYNPFLEESKGAEKKKLRERLTKEINKGALAVTPTGAAISKTNYGSLRKRLKSISEEVKEKPSTIKETPFDKRRMRNAIGTNRNG